MLLSADTLLLRVIDASCGREDALGTTQLLADNDAYDAAAVSAADAERLRARTCGRAVLARRGTSAHGHLALGEAWLTAAATAARDWLAVEPRDTVAARMAAVLALAIDGPRRRLAAQGVATTSRQARPTDGNVQPLLAEIGRAVDLGNRDPVVLRVCSALYLESDQYDRAAACSAAAIDTGHDLTYHLIRQAYIAAHQGGSFTQVRSLTEGAIIAAESPSDRAMVGWHLNYRAPGYFGDAKFMKSTSKPAFLVYADLDRWLDADAATRIAIFWSRMGRLGAWSGAGSAERYLYGHFFAIIASGGDLTDCVRPSFPHCRVPADAGTPAKEEVELLAHPARVWDARTRQMRVVMPYAVNTAAWQYHDSVRLRLRELGPASAALPPFPLQRPPTGHSGSGAFVSGYLTLPLATAATPIWQLDVVTGADDHPVGTVTATLAPLEASSDLNLSDLIVGPAEVGLLWQPALATGDSIYLFPTTTLPQAETPLEFQLQVLTTHPIDTARFVIDIRRIDGQGRPDERGLSFTWQTSFASGFHWIQRSIDVRSLGSGTFQVMASVADGPAEAITRWARFRIP